MAADLKRLHGLLPGDIDIVDRTLDDSRWIVLASAAEHARHVPPLRAGQGHGERTLLHPARAQGVSPGAHARHDRARPRRPGARVLSDLAGGREPQARSCRCRWCCWCTAGRGHATAMATTPQHQWLANRGYAVLSVNFRGSTGFGKAFLNAGDLQWGRKMHDDLLDAVDWAVGQGIADPQTRCHHGRLLRRLCHAGGAGVHAAGFLLRGRHRRAFQPRDAAGHRAALLGGLLREPGAPGRRSAEPRTAARCSRSGRRSTPPPASPGRC